ncbi:hypothetical protein [Micromonospora sp. NPDC005367]|uniref:hypothetical protein n=1 Tax=Micromonospora sp. NPDC005367 TaxID=3155590 RepID=UPI0033ADB6F5
MAGGRPTAQPHKAGPAKKTGWQIATGLGAVVVLTGGCGAGALSGDDGPAVSPPTATERTDTVPILQRAAAAQGICYGWTLQTGTDVVSVGSNLGEGVVVEGDPRCPRWVRVVADITYVSESSESNDYAYVTVEGSTDLDQSPLLAVAAGLERFGLNEDAFLDEPGWAVTRAAVSLPLLLAEAGAAVPVPIATTTPAAAPPPPLPAAGNDLWRDRWGYLLAAAGMLLLTALLVTVGLVQRRRERREATAPATAVTASGRTPEER